MDVDKGE